jgi:hypothetical protein
MYAAEETAKSPEEFALILLLCFSDNPFHGYAKFSKLAF